MWGQIMAGHFCPATLTRPRCSSACRLSTAQPATCSMSTPRRGSQAASSRNVRTHATTAEVASNIRIPELPEEPPAYAANADKYAIVEVGGHQIFVEEGRWYTVNRLVAAPGSKIQLGRVVGCKADGQFNIGRPYLENVVIEADVLEDLKGPKVHIFKYRPKKHYRKRTGHRQPLTKFLVTKIQP